MRASTCLLAAVSWSSAWSYTSSRNKVRKDHDDRHFDYVVVGGGTAGLVVASRLSEDPQVTVAVIEAGDFEGNNPNVTNTTTLGIGKHTSLDWQYESVPQTFVANKSLIWSAGKGLGGSSLINGMTYIRPASSQLDIWPSLGLEMDWNIVFNSSKKGEGFQSPSSALTELGACYEASDHGFDGPISTCISPHMVTGDIHDTFNTSFKNMGIKPRCDFDGGDLLGYGVQMVTQDGRADVRDDAARAYLYPFLNRPNLVVMANSTATRILWSDCKEEAIASAVEVMQQNGQLLRVYADTEVVLSAGAIRSPAILENSGVGNSAILNKLSIDVKIDLPAVGENLQDQTTMAIVASGLRNYTGFPVFVSFVTLQDLFGNDAASIYQSTLAKLPDYAAKIAANNGGASSAAVQEQILKSQLDLLMNSNTPASEIVPLVLETVIGGLFWPLQPFSRGNVHINSTNMTATPVIDARFFEFDFDGQMAVASAKFVRKILTTSPTSDIVNQTSINPSLEMVPEDATDDVWLKWIKTQGDVQPNYHHLGTCAMLPKEMGGVVDNDFKVYGTKNVRVVDLSIVPVQVAGHSTALLYGIAEWAAEKIKSR